MRFRLRTLMIVLAIGPPVLAIAWISYSEFRRYKIQNIPLIIIEEEDPPNLKTSKP
jgi:hypothetical protein